jgi:diacylglycerol kinase (ATP)
MPLHRLLLIVNPRGGRRRGLEVSRRARAAFAAAGVTVDLHLTEFAGHAQELAGTADLRGVDGCCLIGGDGTLNEVVNGLLARPADQRVPIGIIPGGTGNSVWQHLGGTTVDRAIETILAGRARPLDVARVTCGDLTTHAVNIIGWGSVVDINRAAERMRWLGPPRYALAALWHIARARRRPLVLTLDGQLPTDRQVIDDRFLLVAGCNTRFTGKGMDLAPRADAADGLIDVVLVRQATRRQMLALFRRVFTGTHLALPCVEYRQVRAFRLESPAPDPLNIDGELKGHTPVSVELLAGALRVFG